MKSYFYEENSKLYYVRYIRIEGAENEWITIATTRPETILGDTPVAVNPNDESVSAFERKEGNYSDGIIVRCPIIFDRYVEMEFGTGALKVTPCS